MLEGSYTCLQLQDKNADNISAKLCYYKSDVLWVIQ